MKPKIKLLSEKKLIGYNLKMSIINDKTAQLWGQFSPCIKEINNRTSTDKISMQVYESSYFEKFDPTAEFQKWATVEVHHFEDIPSGMMPFTLSGGQYAVFHYKGSSTDKSIYQYIFQTWLPSSPYQLADRPHFEVLGEKYRNNDAESEEEIWIPILG